MGLRVRRPSRWILLLLLVALGGVSIWWLGHVPYDPLAIYRPIPSSAMVVGRHLSLPERWEEVVANPLVRAALRTGGAEPEDAAALATDEESLAWFRKLAGREAVLAILPGRFSGAQTLMAVSWLGTEARKLRWQLSLFRLPGFERLASRFPGHSVWRVAAPTVPPGQQLVVAFGNGLLMACLSPSSLAIAEVLGTYDGNVVSLLEEEDEFARFVAEDDRTMPDRIWLRGETPWNPASSSSWTVDVSSFGGEAMGLRARTKGLAWMPEARPPAVALANLSALLTQEPNLAVTFRLDGLRQLLGQPWLRGNFRHAVRMFTEVAEERIVAFVLDGAYAGRLSLGMMNTLGLSGLRVPTLLLATPSADALTTAAALGRVLDSSNARYRGAFVLRPVSTPSGVVLYALESAGGDEWVDLLAPADRPAYVVVDGWLLASSNLRVLEKIIEARSSGVAPPSMPPAWAQVLDGEGAGMLWLDIDRAGKTAKDVMATWSMAQLFLHGSQSQEARAQWNDLKAWIDSFLPFGVGRMEWARRDGETTLRLDLGLSASSALE
ncbi:MAG: hypothetical protein LBN38_01115 [Verrucomicrobiota bacterium]|nr:hypothetical protein [Verrucomicrobiota bacterium]